jgi:hypothetical protein
MAKFKIAQDPTFKKDVDIPRVNGTFNKVSFTFKYRNRKELAALFTGWNQAIKDDQVRLEEKGDGITLIDITEADIERQIDQVTELVVGWGFYDELTPDAIRELVETSAGAGDAIVKAYQDSFAAVRLGN